MYTANLPAAIRAAIAAIAFSPSHGEVKAAEAVLAAAGYRYDALRGAVRDA